MALPAGEQFAYPLQYGEQHQGEQYYSQQQYGEDIEQSHMPSMLDPTPFAEQIRSGQGGKRSTTSRAGRKVTSYTDFTIGEQEAPIPSGPATQTSGPVSQPFDPASQPLPPLPPPPPPADPNPPRSVIGYIHRVSDKSSEWVHDPKQMIISGAPARPVTEHNIFAWDPTSHRSKDSGFSGGGYGAEYGAAGGGQYNAQLGGTYNVHDINLLLSGLSQQSQASSIGGHNLNRTNPPGGTQRKQPYAGTVSARMQPQGKIPSGAVAWVVLKVDQSEWVYMQEDAANNSSYLGYYNSKRTGQQGITQSKGSGNRRTATSKSGSGTKGREARHGNERRSPIHQQGSEPRDSHLSTPEHTRRSGEGNSSRSEGPIASGHAQRRDSDDDLFGLRAYLGEDHPDYQVQGSGDPTRGEGSSTSRTKTPTESGRRKASVHDLDKARDKKKSS
ncbi:hypothetical protein L207DRAFT_539238 [Hyaloscypha variabilis F]|uniref:Uncharacterized protein n=1 Tax=Hyaloscypha variabilis (strain UAMH 11265 / GT02V1 / F) TaxID=1149755 RepID=A0A2J6QRZ0_HYAVF|nr:hypothetical protein L207DRAFT_539238 [Hyaloscypha variabilis F]